MTDLEVSCLSSNNTYARREEHDGLATFASPTLFGRTNDSLVLLRALQSARQQSQVVTVHESSGMGKTSLVEATLRDAVCQANGYFCAGKFFQNSTDELYSAIMAAFSDLCDLVSQSEDFIERRGIIRESLGTEAHVLLNLVSSIQPFLPASKKDYGVEEETSDANCVALASKTAFTTFKIACKNFLRVMSDINHPVVLFLDDVQWASKGSQELILALLEAIDDLQNVVIVLAYRDEETNAVSGLIGKISNPVDIQLQNLEVNAIRQLLSLQLGRPDVYELGKLVEMKTHGNPFYVLQYLAFIQAEGLLTCSTRVENDSWKFEIDQLQRVTTVPETLVEMLKCKIDRLPAEVQQTLMVASFLGFSFERNLLIQVMLSRQQHLDKSSGNSIDEAIVDRALIMATREGLVDATINANVYLFSHDKLQSAFFDRARFGDYSTRYHFIIAQCYLDLKKLNGEYVLQAAHHANLVIEPFMKKYSRVALAALNLEAGEYCIERSDFSGAAEHLQKGLCLLQSGNDMWLDDHDLVLAIVEKLSAMELILGNFSACKFLTKELLAHSTNLETRLRVMQLDVKTKQAENKIKESIQAGRNALLEINVAVSIKPNKVQILLLFMQVRRLLRNKDDGDIFNLSTVSDPVQVAKHRFLVDISVFSILEDNEEPSIYSALMVVKSTLRDGLTPYSIDGIILYAVCEVERGNHTRAYRYGRLGLNLLRKWKHRQVENVTRAMLYVGVLHWKEPLREHFEPLSQAMNDAFAAGNFWCGYFAASNSFAAGLSSGKNLVILAEHTRQVCERLKEYKQEKLMIWILPGFQCILNLISSFGDWKSATELTGEVMNEADYLQTCVETNYVSLIGTMYMFKLLLAFHFGDFHLAKKCLKKMESTAKVMRLHFHFYTYHFIASMTYLTLFRKTAKRIHEKKYRHHKKQLEQLRLIQCPNSEPLLKILIAEECSLKRNDTSTYWLAAKEAAKACADEGMVQYEGFVYERAGFILGEKNEFHKASECFVRAAKLYREDWGSSAKCAWLTEMSQQHTSGI